MTTHLTHPDPAVRQRITEAREQGRAEARAGIAAAIRTEPWERHSTRGPGTDNATLQGFWVHGANAGVEFAARIAETWEADQ